MTTLEQEIIEKFHQLDPAAQQRVRQIIEQEATLPDQPPISAFLALNTCTCCECR
jgi:hypothetical protein